MAVRLGDVLEDDNFDRVGFLFGLVIASALSARCATRHSQKTLAFSSAFLPRSAARLHLKREILSTLYDILRHFGPR